MTTSVGADTSLAFVVGVLTAVARRTDDHGGVRDFAGFLATALASVAANVGGADRLFAGRSGSWEASLVEDLVRGMVGDDQIELARRRTEPIVVPLNVAELIEDGYDHPGLLGLYDAMAEVDRRWDPSVTEAEEDACEAEVAATEGRYATSFRAYAAAFAAAVNDHAVALGLQPDAAVIDIDDDPKSTWWADGATRNPDGWDEGELIFRLWDFAHAVVPLPNVNISRPQQLIKDGDEHE